MGDREREIRARLEAATPGEWRRRGKAVEHITMVAWCGESITCSLRDGESETIDSDQAERNANFIAHAGGTAGDVAWLLAEVERLRRERDAATAAAELAALRRVVRRALMVLEDEETGWDEVRDALRPSGLRRYHGDEPGAVAVEAALKREKP